MKKQQPLGSDEAKSLLGAMLSPNSMAKRGLLPSLTPKTSTTKTTQLPVSQQATVVEESPNEA